MKTGMGAQWIDSTSTEWIDDPHTTWKWHYTTWRRPYTAPGAVHIVPNTAGVPCGPYYDELHDDGYYPVMPAQPSVHVSIFSADSADTEIAALDKIIKALESLDREARERVLEYINNRFGKAKED